MPPGRTLTRVWAIGVAAAASVAACSTSSGGTPRIERAPDLTMGAGTARVVEHIVTTASSGGVTDATAEGTADFTSRQLQLKVVEAGQTTDIVYDGTTVYERLPPLASEIAGKPWLRLDVNALDQLGGVPGLGQLAESQPTDPSDGLQLLHGVTGPISNLGTETIRGAITHHLRANADLGLAASRVPAAQAAPLRRIIDSLHVHSTVIDVWTDAVDLVRRYHLSLDYSRAQLPGGLAAPRSVDLTVELFDFGANLSVTMPATEQTADLAQVLNPTRPPALNATPIDPAVVISALEGLLITGVPAGYVRGDDAAPNSGPASLQQAVAEDGQPDAGQVLVADGFLGGYRRIWTNGGTQITDSVYRFASASGATGYGDRRDAAAAAPPAGSRIAPVVVAGIPKAEGFAVAAPDGVVDTVLFVKGPFSVRLVVRGPGARTDLATALAQQQYERL